MENIIEIDGKRYKVTLLQPETEQPKAPTTIEEVLEAVRPEWYTVSSYIARRTEFVEEKEQIPTEAHAKSVLALCQLYNVAKCLNECFEGEPLAQTTVGKGRQLIQNLTNYPYVVIFTSRAAAQHAADHFWHLFADFYMLEDKQ